MNKISTGLYSLHLVGIHRLAFTKAELYLRKSISRSRVHKLAISSMRDLFGDFNTIPKLSTICKPSWPRLYPHRIWRTQHNLHVMLRFDLERLLISGDLKVGDVAALNERFEADFGYSWEAIQGSARRSLKSRSFWLFSNLYTWQRLCRCLFQKNERKRSQISMFLYQTAI